MRPGRRSSRVPSPSATRAKAGVEPHLPSLLIGSPAHYFCLTCCSSLWEERVLPLACIPDHHGCRGYPGWLRSSWVNLCAPFVGCGAAPFVSCRARSPELASVGAEMRGPALEWVVLGNRLSPGRKNGSPSKPVRRQFLFLQSQLPLFKRAGLVQTRTAPLIFLNWLPREGSGKGF